MNSLGVAYRLPAIYRFVIYNHMVMQRDELGVVFAALSDPTRRGMLERLSEGEANVSTLAAAYDISQPGVSKHLKVLERAGLIVRQRRGREQIVRVVSAPAEEARDWLSRYVVYWKRRFDAVDAYLKKKERSKHGNKS